MTDPAPSTAPTREVMLAVAGMTCASCAVRVERNLNRMPGVEATVNYATATAHVRYPEDMAPDALVGTVEATGYSADLPPADARAGESAEPAYDGAVRLVASIANRSDDVIGYVFAINGKVNSADIYGSNVLFKKLWPKLLKANAIEAIAELQPGKFQPASADSVQGFLSDSEKAKGSDKDVNARVNLMTREDSENIFFETRDKKENGAWVHRNYIKKN